MLSSSILLTFGETVIGRKRLLIKTSTSVNHLIPIVPLFIYLFTFLTFSPTSAEPWIASERYVNGRKICGKHTHHSDQGSLLTFVYSHTFSQNLEDTPIPQPIPLTMSGTIRVGWGLPRRVDGQGIQDYISHNLTNTLRDGYVESGRLTRKWKDYLGSWGQESIKESYTCSKLPPTTHPVSSLWPARNTHTNIEITRVSFPPVSYRDGAQVFLLGHGSQVR